jgi:hypothetical protein
MNFNAENPQFAKSKNVENLNSPLQKLTNISDYQADNQAFKR